mmetsp:Transcript_2684/g.6711  ORF Transcript_2684/g.6711 Transcript_2684/m.6711 type:complete len:316 (-) Transcript_2684:140-1087(-)
MLSRNNSVLLYILSSSHPNPSFGILLFLLLRLQLIPRPHELRRNVAILNLRQRHPLSPPSAPQIHDVEVITLPPIIERYRGSQRKRAVVLQFRLQHRLVIADVDERRRVGPQPHGRAGGNGRRQPDVHDVARTQSERFEHPLRQERVVVRAAEVDGASHRPREGGRGGVMVLVDGDGDAGRGDVGDAGHLEQPRDLRLAVGDGIPKVPGEAHLVARVDVAVAEHAHGRIEQPVLEGQGYASSVADGIDGIRGRGDVFGIVILHGLFQYGDGLGVGPLRCQEGHEAVAEEGGGGVLGGGVEVERRGRRRRGGDGSG